ncbi:hypothetical protein LSH36_257g03024, partial [Paralvinella palmiformis]
CDSGFGYALAKTLSGYGILVYAGCYTASAGNRLKQETGSNLRPITLDVTDSASVRRAAEFVRHTLSKDKQLWAIVNNAGILGHTLPTEMLTKEDFRQVFEVNVFGMVDVTNAFLPLLKRSRGRIVNMASIAGIVPFPNWTPYISSKHAAKGQLWTHKLLHGEASTQLHKVVRAYEDALFSKNPRAVYYPGCAAKYILAIQTLPGIIWDRYLLTKLTVFPKAVRK